MKLIPIDKILANPWQTRITEPMSEYIKELAMDIAKNGLLQVPVGRYINLGPFPLSERVKDVELAFGHSRLAAYRWLEDHRADAIRPYEGDWSLMPVDVRELTDVQMANLAWSENEKRRDVTPIERARAIQKRIEDFKWSNREAAEALGIDHSTISNILRLLKLPENLQTALQAGEMTERQAGAILVLFELPEFEEGFMYWDRKKDIISAALDGESSDSLRRRVEKYLNSHSKTLEKAEFGRNFAIPEGGKVYCGTCETCDKRYRNRNLCFDGDCFTAKTDFVRHKYLEEASFISGYPILDQNKGGNPGQFSRYDGEIEKVKAIKCPNMVLEYTIDKSEDVAGFPNARLVCEKRNDSCTCKIGIVLRAKQPERLGEVAEVEKVAEESEGDESEGLEKLSTDSGSGLNGLEKAAMEVQPAGPTARDLEEAARQARKDKKEALERRGEIYHLVTKRLVQALKEDAPGVFYLIAHQSAYVYANSSMDLEDSYQAIAKKCANYPVMPSQADSLPEMIRIINERLANLKLEPISLETTLVEVFAEEEVCTQTEGI